MTDLRSSIAALYAGPVEHFVTARDALVKSLRTAGEADAADEVKALRRPTAAATALNRLAQDPVVAQLCDLGDRLRDAQQRVDAPAMRALSNERTAAIDQLLEALGQPTGTLRDQVMATATAALADPAAGAALRSGRLTKALSYSGFGEVDLSDAVARWSETTGAAPAAKKTSDKKTSTNKTSDKKSPPKTTATQKSKQKPDHHAAARRARLQQAVSAAEDELRTADETLSAAQQRHAAAEQALAEARRQLNEAGG
ncbi:hypothetical protein [Branchiibius sp. NY16-3462-2]|uniref:hypothetical protein n=1 Tax=Branchiibius sp. NY16-3462-2 TaxID=1807500 RepID=UPI000B069D3B|nr:hypothetical protein [Branchiibius sp. NY16-3462-2]